MKQEVDELARGKEALERLSYQLLDELRNTKQRVEEQQHEINQSAQELKNKGKKLEEENRQMVSVTALLPIPSTYIQLPNLNALSQPTLFYPTDPSFSYSNPPFPIRPSIHPPTHLTSPIPQSPIPNPQTPIPHSPLPKPPFPHLPIPISPARHSTVSPTSPAASSL